MSGETPIGLSMFEVNKLLMRANFQRWPGAQPYSRLIAISESKPIATNHHPGGFNKTIIYLRTFDHRCSHYKGKLT